MCDTQALIADNGVWLAKNSDREPSEPQAVVRLAAVRDDRASMLRTTYLEIEQQANRHACILSKPVWCWGAEMGVNEHGVAIGNEAIFSKLASRAPALLGMDLLRLALERADSAEAALLVITELLERYGQGGPAGYRDGQFCYDNSFLIADGKQVWLLETAGRHWAARAVEQSAAISNQLSLRQDWQQSSSSVQRLSAQRGDKLDFAAHFDTRLMPWFAASARRRALAQHCLAEAGSAPEFSRFAEHLRSHAAGDDAPLDGSNADLCLHAAGPIRRSQTTGSMIVQLAPGRAPRMAFTGTSAPCLSIFRPADFAAAWSVLTPPAQQLAAPLWHLHEPLHRRALFDPQLRAQIRSSRVAVEAQMFAALGRADAVEMQAADQAVFEWLQHMLARCGEAPAVQSSRYWRKLNRMDGIHLATRSAL